MSDSNAEEEPTIKDESEMEVEDKRAERKEEKEKKTKTCYFITIIIILSLISVGLLIALIIVAVNKKEDNSSSSPLQYSELYVSNEEKGKGDCTSSSNACDSISKAYKMINAEGDNKIYVISETLNAEEEEIVIENSVTITKPDSSSFHTNQQSSISIKVCDIDKEGEKKSLFSMFYKSRTLNINYLSFLLEKDTLKPSKPVISMGAGSLSLLSCSFGRVDEANDILSSSIVDITDGNCVINSCSFNNIQREEGNGGAISANLNAGSSLEITATVLNNCACNKGNGGGIYTVNDYGSYLILKNVDFIGCESKVGDGGAMYSEVKDGAKMKIGENEGEDCSFKGCKAGSEGALMKGGGLYVKVNNSINILINNVIFGKEEGELNEAMNGKGIFLETDEWNENTINAMFPVISKEGKENREILEGMKIKEGEDGEIIDLYTVAYADGNTDSLFSLTIQVSQIKESNKIKVQWESDKNIDEIKVEIVRGDKVFYTYTSSDDAVIRFRRSINMEGIYGRERVRVTARRSSYSEMQSVEINVTASHYIIAPLVATTPVTLFTLKMKEYTNDYTIPTLIWLERYETFDWTSLPNNFFLIPTFEDGEIDNKYMVDGYKRTGEYVKELHEINPQSTYELYICDLHIFGALMIVYANDINPLFKIHMLTDGYGTQEPFNKIFEKCEKDDLSEADNTYNKLKEEWFELRDSVIKNKKFDSSMEQYYNAWEFRLYLVAIMGEESNVDWTILSALKFIVGDDAKKINWITQNFTVKTNKLKIDNLGNIFKALKEDEKETVKETFHMSSSFFEKAEEEQKKIHCIIGTNPEEANLEILLKCVKKLAGDEYILYYKGHPGNPTQNNTERKEILERLNIYDVESSIPFEMIYFYNKNMVASGYESGSFNSFMLDKDTYISECFFAIFNYRKAEALSKKTTLPYMEYFKYYLTASLKNIEELSKYARGDNSMLIEYGESDNKIAVYDPDDDTIKFYEKNGSGNEFQEVNK